MAANHAVTGLITGKGLDIMIDNILVPLDRSDTAERVSNWAASLAARTGAKITLLAIVDPDWLSVLEPIGPGRRFDSGGSVGVVTAAGSTVGATRPVSTEQRSDVEPGYGSHAIDEAVQTARGYLTARKRTLEGQGISVETDVWMGDPSSQIRIAAKELDAGLIVMATHRETPVSRGVLGSVTDRVVRTSGVPVMAIHPDTLKALESSDNAVRTIVLPLDGSDESERAIPVATELAQSANADIVLLSAYGSGFLGFFGSETTAKLHRVEFGTYLERIGDDQIPDGIKTSVVTVNGDADDAIRKTAAENEDSIIVLASHGSSGLKRMILGSVADKVIRTAERPVVVVSEAQ